VHVTATKLDGHRRACDAQRPQIPREAGPRQAGHQGRRAEGRVGDRHQDRSQACTARQEAADAETADSLEATTELDSGDDLDAEPDVLVDEPDIELEDLDADEPATDDAEETADGAKKPIESAAVPAAPAEAEEDITEPSEKDKASGDFVWDEEESEALRQARKDAELTASADSVRAYLKQIGKVALLNAEEEVELAKRIEAGLYSTQLMSDFAEKGEKLTTAQRRDYTWICRDGDRAKNHLLEANLRLVVSLAKRYTGRAWPSSTSSRKATSA